MKLTTKIVTWPLRQPFTIARETWTAITCIQATLTDAQGRIGRGEAVGVEYAGETPESMLAQIEAVRPHVDSGLTLESLQGLLPAGGARNALDCALWDLNAKRSGIPAWRAAGLRSFEPRPTSFTFGIMAEQLLRSVARSYAHFPLLKVKTDREHGLDPARIKPILDVALTRFEEHQALRRDLDQANAALAERKVVERAKGVLMKQRNIGEAEAYQAMRKMAMERSMKMAELAQQIIAASVLLA